MGTMRRRCAALVLSVGALVGTFVILHFAQEARALPDRPTAFRGIAVSTTPDRAAPRPLAGWKMIGRGYVFVLDDRDVRRVRFMLDDTKVIRTDSRPPFDLVGGTLETAAALRPDSVADGRHVLRAEVEYRSGKTRVYKATFGVEHLFMSPTGSDSGTCKRTAPCLSFARAYKVAQPGQTIELAGGTYQSETIAEPPREPGQPLTFKPSEGARPTVDGVLRWEGQRDVVVDGLSIRTWYVKLVDDFTFRNVTTTEFFIRSSSRVRVLGGSVGGIQNGDSPTIGISEASAPLTKDVVIDGVLFHDIGRQECPGCHVECLFIQESTNVVVRNSRFTRCDIMDIFVEDLFGTPPSNLTLENNWFDAPTGGGFYPVNIRWDPGDTIQGHVIRYNSFNGTLYLYEGTYANVSVYANVGNVSACRPGVAYAYNVWRTMRCAPTDRLAQRLFANPAGFDLRPVAGAASIDAGDPKRFPRFDIFGHQRPKGKRPDAGAVEFR